MIFQHFGSITSRNKLFLLPNHYYYIKLWRVHRFWITSLYFRCYRSSSLFFFPPPLKIDGQASLPFGKRLGNDSSRKHPPGYPASVPPHRQITPRRQQWAKQCNSRFIVSRAGYELRKLAESRGGSDYCTTSTRFHALGPHENLLQVGSVGATTPRWRNRRVKIDGKMGRNWFRASDPSSFLCHGLRKRRRCEWSTRGRTPCYERFVKSIWISMGFSRFLQNSTLFFFSSKCLESCRDVRLKSKVHLDFGSSISNLEIGFSCHFLFFF